MVFRMRKQRYKDDHDKYKDIIEKYEQRKDKLNAFIKFLKI